MTVQITMKLKSQVYHWVLKSVYDVTSGTDLKTQ